MSDTLGIYQTTAPAPMYRADLVTAKAYEPVKGKPQGPPRFGLTLGFTPDHADLANMKKLAAQVARAKFPTTPFAELSFPFQSGEKAIEKAVASARRKGKTEKDLADLAEKLKHFNGKVLMTARTGAEYPPDLAILLNNEIVDIGLPVDPTGALLRQHGSKLWNGGEVFTKIKFAAHDAVGNNPAGVNVYLLSVFATGKGERIGGRGSSASTWAAYRGQVSQEDPMAGAASDRDLDDEIPF